MLLSELKVGQFFKLENGMIFRVECNEWWLNGRLKDFICVNSKGRKKHYTLLDNTTEIDAVIIDGVEKKSICENCSQSFISEN